MFNNGRRLPLITLAAAGLLWGGTVPMTKLALGVLAPGWLTVARFALAAVPLLWVLRRSLRSALSPAVMAWGAVGYGLVIALQSAGIARTSVSHAALLAGGVPALVALMTLGLGRSQARASAWTGYVVALAGIALVAVGGGGHSALSGDLLVGVSLVLSAAYTVAMPAVLDGRDPAAVTAVQFVAAAVVALPVAVIHDGAPVLHGGLTAVLLVAALVIGGTIAPFTLFAWGQARTTPEVAGAFLNLEPVVGAAAGAAAFGDPFGRAQMLGGAAVLGGIGLTALPVRLSLVSLRTRLARIVRLLHYFTSGTTRLASQAAISARPEVAHLPRRGWLHDGAPIRLLAANPANDVLVASFGTRLQRDRRCEPPHPGGLRGGDGDALTGWHASSCLAA